MPALNPAASVNRFRARAAQAAAERRIFGLAVGLLLGLCFAVLLGLTLYLR